MPQDRVQVDIPQQQEEERHERASGCLARLFWMMLGNFILAIAALKVFEGPSLGLTWADGLYWITVVSLLAVRYADVRYLDGKKADGEPATMTDWQRYSGMLVGGTLVVWVLLHAVAGFSF